ncbi:pilus assembly protein TadG-related protein [Terrabacter sp. BE26]|uniref:pilus assembly protein TadG-related protein n=1 Tax=Terrabacter sp. BE26 TaxID=2898152 RepID=UPI0035BE2DAE
MSRCLITKVRRLRRDDQGYVAIMVALMSSVLLCMCALTVDVGYWYVVASQAQKAADAAALGGVPNLPGNQSAAFTAAQLLAKQNGFANGVASTSVATSIGNQPSRLRVTVTRTVDNFFGPLFGIPKTTITRSAMADYVGPLPMGSPCNEFGNDPDNGTDNRRSTNCSNAGQFWANVGSWSASKLSGDAYQNNSCGSGIDGCTGSLNTDYDPNGYYYVVTLTRAVSNLQFEAFDPALVAVGDLCGDGTNPTSDKSLTGKDRNGIADPRYAKGAASPFCTGDVRFGGTGEVSTQFTVREAGSSTTFWDPASYTARTGCNKVFAGYNLPNNATAISTMPLGTYNVFRKWTPLCDSPIASAPAGQYMIQVKTNGLGTDAASGHNRFGLRVYSTSDTTAKDAISIAGFSKMAIYANLPSATTTFFLARVPSAAAGQVLNVKLFDIGDSTGSGTVSILSPSGGPLTGCTGSGPITSVPNCKFTANSTFNGKWQVVSVPIPPTYSCVDSDPNACWFKLQYYYGLGNQPSDTTSWSAALAANPVRLVE